MNRDANDIENALQPKTIQDQQIQMQKCESFSREVFTKVIKVFITEKLIPKIRTHVS
jgi:hypothetical protein